MKWANYNLYHKALEMQSLTSKKDHQIKTRILSLDGVQQCCARKQSTFPQTWKQKDKHGEKPESQNHPM